MQAGWVPNPGARGDGVVAGVCSGDLPMVGTGAVNVGGDDGENFVQAMNEVVAIGAVAANATAYVDANLGISRAKSFAGSSGRSTE